MEAVECVRARVCVCGGGVDGYVVVLLGVWLVVPAVVVQRLLHQPAGTTNSYRRWIKAGLVEMIAGAWICNVERCDSEVGSRLDDRLSRAVEVHLLRRQ